MRSYEFMRETLTTTCQTVGKAKKEENHGVIYVVTKLPDWKIKCAPRARERTNARTNAKCTYKCTNKRVHKRTTFAQA